MDTKLGKTPWVLGITGDKACEDPGHIMTEDGYAIADCTLDYSSIEPEEQAVIARRIVACVNACEGIPTEALECQSKRKISESLVKQRDAMLDALRMAESFIAKLEDDDNYTDGQVETINAIRSAIAKATP